MHQATGGAGAATLIAMLVLAPDAKAEGSGITIEGEIGASVSYVSGAPFYDRFSEHPQARFSLAARTGGFHAEAYAYADLEEGGFGGDASERGFEVGYEWELGENSSFALAGGRWENYNGGGSDAGDWFVQATVSHEAFSVSVTGLKNGEDSYAIVSAGYELEAGPGSVTPGVSFYTDGRVTFGIEGELPLSERFALTGVIVSAEADDGLGHEERETYATAGFAFRF